MQSETNWAPCRLRNPICRPRQLLLVLAPCLEVGGFENTVTVAGRTFALECQGVECLKTLVLNMIFSRIVISTHQESQHGRKSIGQSQLLGPIPCFCAFRWSRLVACSHISSRDNRRFRVFESAERVLFLTKDINDFHVYIYIYIYRYIYIYGPAFGGIYVSCIRM